ncbi:hypothetical protein DPEC_G00187920 [Dallia pectoralis]|uniref:Uncharacterized protein n=1 Tax=Dallia pectoralis TaxID=75939 RepID=A0ACC2GCD1_DALPE|nr:hypothetical protein DPEC_G00187920 [Dallia pectoralis]
MLFGAPDIVEEKGVLAQPEAAAVLGPQQIYDLTFRTLDFCVSTLEKTKMDDMVTNRTPSKWLKKVTSSRVPVYLDSEELQDILSSYLRGVLDRTPTQLSFTDKVQFICGVLFPEAIIYALAVLRSVSLQEAEQVFLSGPDYHYSEVEELNQKN